MAKMVIDLDKLAKMVYLDKWKNLKKLFSFHFKLLEK